MERQAKFNNGHRLHSIEEVGAILDLSDATSRVRNLISNPLLDTDRRAYAIAEILNAAAQAGLLPEEEICQMVERFYPGFYPKENS
jgi:hypothetical protein